MLCTFVKNTQPVHPPVALFAAQYGVKLTEFPVTLSFDGGRPKALTKAFQRRYTAGRGKDADQDAIYEIGLFPRKCGWHKPVEVKK